MPEGTAIILEPCYTSLERLIAEDGMCITAGLPEGVRRELDRLEAERKRIEQGMADRARMREFVLKAVELDAKLQETEKELAAVLREYTTRQAALYTKADAA